MTDPGTHFANIPPVPGDVERPIWSVMIPAYNCARYLPQTIQSVVEQAPEPAVMQIEVVDDHSPKDDLREITAMAGKGRVAFYRQPQNVGHTGNFETCLKRSRGHLIHLLHGDDYVRPGFYERMQQVFDQHPEVGMAFCRNIIMDEHGHWQWINELLEPTSGILEGWLERIAVTQQVHTPSVVVRREVYEKLGGFDRRLSWTEDWEMWVRIAANYPVWYETEPLAVYREHSSSNTGRYIRTGENLKDSNRAVEIISRSIPADRRPALSAKARRIVAMSAIHGMRRLARLDDWKGVMAQMWEGGRVSRSLRVWISLFGTLMKIGMGSLRRALHGLRG